MGDKRILDENRLHECKEAYDLYKTGKYAHRDIAEMLKVSHSTVQRRISLYEHHMHATGGQPQKAVAAPVSDSHNGDYQFSAWKPKVEPAPATVAAPQSELQAAIAMLMQTQAQQSEMIRMLMSNQQAAAVAAATGITAPVTAPAPTPDPEYVIPRKKWERIGVIPDMHAPYQHPDTLEFIQCVGEKYRIEDWVCLGDETDGHAISFHKSNPDLMSAGPELEAAREFLHKLEKMIPDMDLVESNHGSLVYRRSFDCGLPSMVMRSYREILFGEKRKDGSVYLPDGRGQGWRWHEKLEVTLPYDTRVLFVHSYSANVKNAVGAAGLSIVQGHHHGTGDVSWHQGDGGTRFGVTAQSLIDYKHLAFAYGKTFPKKPILGMSVIIDAEPHLIRMRTDERGRWIGKIADL